MDQGSDKGFLLHCADPRWYALVTAHYERGNAGSRDAEPNSTDSTDPPAPSGSSSRTPAGALGTIVLA
jgi:hypothetical protein